MPIIEVNMLEGRTDEQKRAMVSSMTEAVIKSLDVPPQSVRIMIREMEPRHYAIGGVMRDASG
ncbi:MAG: 2-hydroxymuconate tautomerase [Alphaproteobacteria bacterium]|jgi:4-oxalocrotonate tautomerase